MAMMECGPLRMARCRGVMVRAAEGSRYGNSILLCKEMMHILFPWVAGSRDRNLLLGTWMHPVLGVVVDGLLPIVHSLQGVTVRDQRLVCGMCIVSSDLIVPPSEKVKLHRVDMVGRGGCMMCCCPLL
jgi:hypothetical protein